MDSMLLWNQHAAWNMKKKTSMLLWYFAELIQAEKNWGHFVFLITMDSMLLWNQHAATNKKKITSMLLCSKWRTESSTKDQRPLQISNHIGHHAASNQHAAFTLYILDSMLVHHCPRWKPACCWKCTKSNQHAGSCERCKLDSAPWFADLIDFDCLWPLETCILYIETCLLQHNTNSTTSYQITLKQIIFSLRIITYIFSIRFLTFNPCSINYYLVYLEWFVSLLYSRFIREIF